MYEIAENGNTQVEISQIFVLQFLNTCTELLFTTEEIAINKKLQNLIWHVEIIDILWLVRGVSLTQKAFRKYLQCT